ncbi:AbrB family transcriptional regulator [Calothrix sp. UHCC 0171]|uniref:AbrB family transcriptional regulator n=1 Tax=Calothrix sp. UHCC 0171 TaxID=3110245 RepID=UPI002B1E961C|nr:AbrB family transcriptional regulator [Calothrix sp. UHCC 0171]MEA5572504.1 AbrB family transcriptional regulator [Calothrix sp. UHCC 0171]
MNQTLSATPTSRVSAHETASVTKLQISPKKLIILTLELLLAIPLGYILTQFNFGGIAWIFGGIAAGGIIFQSIRILFQYQAKPNRMARKVGMVLVGLAIGFSNAKANFANVAEGIPVYIVLTFFLLISGCGIGYVYSRLSKTNLLTAMLATVPGGVGVMSAIAADYNRNVTLVALVQVIRVTSVVLLIPLIARTGIDTDVVQPYFLSNSPLINLEPSYLGLLGIVFLFVVIAVNFAVRLQIPAADFFAALMVGMSFHSIMNSLPFVSEINFTPPSLSNLIGQMLLGITIGEYWGEKPTFSKRTLIYAIVCAIATLVAGVFASLIAMFLTDWDWLTCLLVTAPGGAAEMILVALSLNHHVEIVTAGHLVRLMAINASLPLWLYLFRRLDKVRG